MKDELARCQALDDAALLSQTERMSKADHRLTAALIARLSEVDARGLFASEMGFSSMFDYCSRFLRYGEGAAYKRIRIARLIRNFPMVLQAIETGDISLAGMLVISPYLTEENLSSLLGFARRKSMRELERYVASIAPRPDVADSIRRLPGSVKPSEPCLLDLAHKAAPISAIISPAAVTPDRTRETIELLSPQRVQFRFSGTEELLGKVERAKQILRHKFPFAGLEEIMDAALDVLLDSYDPDRKKPAKKAEPRKIETRSIPQWVKDEVWRRDNGRCAFLTKDGKICGERGWLEYDHIKPWALGGSSDDAANVRLLCRTHNQLRVRQAFGVKAGCT